MSSPVFPTKIKALLSKSSVQVTDDEYQVLLEAFLIDFNFNLSDMKKFPVKTEQCKELIKIHFDNLIRSSFSTSSTCIGRLNYLSEKIDIRDEERAKTLWNLFCKTFSESVSSMNTPDQNGHWNEFLDKVYNAQFFAKLTVEVFRSYETSAASPSSS